MIPFGFTRLGLWLRFAGPARRAGLINPFDNACRVDGPALEAERIAARPLDSMEGLHTVWKPGLIWRRHFPSVRPCLVVQRPSEAHA
jgi:hypothetical protein